MAVLELRQVHARIETRLRERASHAASVESCRSELAALAPEVTRAIEAELLRLTLAVDLDAA
jgi:hypothetical protein